jgi:hypothetical protein
MWSLVRALQADQTTTIFMLLPKSPHEHSVEHFASCEGGGGERKEAAVGGLAAAGSTRREHASSNRGLKRWSGRRRRR